MARRVTVIVTSFQPNHRLHTAVRSLLNQSWANLEILVVDDGSGPEYEALFQQCAGLDERVSVIKLDRNVGTYGARNVAFDIASGEFITCLDSDDWSHPTRLEQQLRPLLADPSHLATIGHAFKATDDLRLSPLSLSPRTTYIPSLLFRRDPVLTASDTWMASGRAPTTSTWPGSTQRSAPAPSIAWVPCSGSTAKRRAHYRALISEESGCTLPGLLTGRRITSGIAGSRLATPTHTWRGPLQAGRLLHQAICAIAKATRRKPKPVTSSSRAT